MVLDYLGRNLDRNINLCLLNSCTVSLYLLILVTRSKILHILLPIVVGRNFLNARELEKSWNLFVKLRTENDLEFINKHNYEFMGQDSFFWCDMG